MVCYVGFSGATAPLRFLLRRLRQRLSEAPLIVMVWPQDQIVSKKEPSSSGPKKLLIANGSKCVLVRVS